MIYNWAGVMERKNDKENSELSQVPACVLAANVPGLERQSDT
jgi:hypothetical protein